MATVKKRKVGFIVVWVVLVLLLAVALGTAALVTGGFKRDLSRMGVAVNGKPIAGSAECVELTPDKPMELLVAFPFAKDADYTLTIVPVKGIDFTYTVDGGAELHFAELDNLLPAFSVTKDKLVAKITPPVGVLDMLGKLYPDRHVVVTNPGTLADGVDWYTVVVTPNIEGVQAVTIGCRSSIGSMMIELDKIEVLY